MLFNLWDSLWVPLLYVLITGHWTSISASLYLHRSITHKGVKFKEPVNFLMRLWLWLATGMSTQEWVACHRKHHRFPDQPEDPHSPVQKGMWHVLFKGVFDYRKAVADKAMVEQYGKGCPDDVLEREFFKPYRQAGIYVLLFINLLLFGWWWFMPVWVCQILWMIFIGHVINGLGHGVGYRNKEVDDHSTNVLPLGILVAGEELHNNHHSNPASPKFSRKWYELDMGWVYIKLLTWARLAEVRYSTTK